MHFMCMNRDQSGAPILAVGPVLYVLHIEVVLKQLYFVDTKQIQNIQGIGIFFKFITKALELFI